MQRLTVRCCSAPRLTVPGKRERERESVVAVHEQCNGNWISLAQLTNNVLIGTLTECMLWEVNHHLHLNCCLFRNHLGFCFDFVPFDNNQGPSSHPLLFSLFLLGPLMALRGPTTIIKIVHFVELVEYAIHVEKVFDQTPIDTWTRQIWTRKMWMTKYFKTSIEQFFSCTSLLCFYVPIGVQLSFVSG